MRSETIPPYRISPDSQIHVGASSLQFRPLIFIWFRSGTVMAEASFFAP